MPIVIRRGKAIQTPPVPPKFVKPEPTVTGPQLDSMVKFLIEEHPNLLVAYFLICSYLYYERDISIISDALFDEICETLDAHWDDVEHPHKRLIDRSMLHAGTGFYIREYPGMTRAAACALVNAQWGTHLRADP